jgi:hypothetical protein
METRVEPEKLNPLRGWLGQNAVWLATMLWFVLVAVKALRVAKMNPQTALVILGSSEVLRVAFFVLLTEAPILFIALAFAASYRGFDPRRGLGIEERVATISLYLVALTFTAATAPMAMMIVLLGLPMSALAIHLKDRRRRGVPRVEDPAVVEIRAAIEEAQVLEAELAGLGEITTATNRAQVDDVLKQRNAVTSRLRAANDLMKAHQLSQNQGRFRSFTPKVFLIGMVGFQAVFLSLPLLSQTPWVPRERMATPSGPLVGYVMGEGEWVTVLAEGSHQISRVRATDLKSRSICQTSSPNDWVSLTAIDVLSSNRTPEYPPCHPKS